MKEHILKCPLTKRSTVSIRLFGQSWVYWFSFRLKSIFATAPVASKNIARFKLIQSDTKIIF